MMNVRQARLASLWQPHKGEGVILQSAPGELLNGRD
jgi:hypothetical protein